MSSTDPPFWKTKTLDEMSSEEWESLCDGCARCCLVKLEDEGTGTCYLTRLACSLLDIGSCRCSDYPNRKARMSDCVTVDAASVRTLEWLPETCAYRLVEEGRDLYWWHPLISGSPDTVHDAGVSVREWARSEKGVKLSAMQSFIIGPADHGPACRAGSAQETTAGSAQAKNSRSRATDNSSKRATEESESRATDDSCRRATNNNRKRASDKPARRRSA